MRHFAVIALLLVAAVLGTSAADTDASRAAALLRQAAGNATTLSCSFEQTRTSSMLASPSTSAGTLSFSRPGLMRWEYRTPYSYAFVLNGDSILTTDGTRSNLINTRSNKLFARIVGLMSKAISGDIEGSRADFDTAVEAHDAVMVITLTPRRRELKHVLRDIVLTVDSTTGLARNLTLHERNGDVTDITFRDHRLNVPVDPVLFRLTPVK